MNKVILMGRLTRDPEVRYTQGNPPMAIGRYTLAVDRRIRRENEQSADFISCVTFGKNAEFAEKYLRQGTKIVISGRIQTGSYQKQDGTRAYTTDVVVEEHDFAESKASQGAAPNTQQQYAQQPRTQQNTQPVPPPAPVDSDGFMYIPEGVDEELPFN